MGPAPFPTSRCLSLTRREGRGQGVSDQTGCGELHTRHPAYKGSSLLTWRESPGRGRALRILVRSAAALGSLHSCHPRHSFINHTHSRRSGAPPGCQARCPDLGERSPTESALRTVSPRYRAGRRGRGAARGRDSSEVPRRVGGSGIQARGRGGGARSYPGAERRAGRKAKGVARRLAILSGRGEARAASPGKGASQPPGRWGSARGGRGAGERSGARGLAGTSS